MHDKLTHFNPSKIPLPRSLLACSLCPVSFHKCDVCNATFWCNCSKRCSLLHMSAALSERHNALCSCVFHSEIAAVFPACLEEPEWPWTSTPTYVVMTGSAALLVWGPFDCGSWHTCICTVLLLVHQTPSSNSDFVPFYSHTVPDLNVRRAD